MDANYTYETPNKAISYAGLVLGIVSALCAAAVLIMSIGKFGLDSFMLNVFWWIAFAFMAVDAILALISQAKRIGSAKISRIGEWIGVAAAVILLIAVFLK